MNSAYRLLEFAYSREHIDCLPVHEHYMQRINREAMQRVERDIQNECIKANIDVACYTVVSWYENSNDCSKLCYAAFVYQGNDQGNCLVIPDNIRQTIKSNMYWSGKVIFDIRKLPDYGNYLYCRKDGSPLKFEPDKATFFVEEYNYKVKLLKYQCKCGEVHEYRMPFNYRHGYNPDDIFTNMRNMTFADREFNDRHNGKWKHYTFGTIAYTESHKGLIASLEP